MYFYCNKPTIAKCLFHGHNGNYWTEEQKKMKSKQNDRDIKVHHRASLAELKTSPQTILDR